MKKFHFTPEFEEVFFPLIDELFQLKQYQIVFGYFPPSCHVLTPLIQRYTDFIADKKETDLYYEVQE